MATKVKTTVTFTFSLETESEDQAIRSLKSWFSEQTKDSLRVMKDSDTGVYTYLNASPSIGHTFSFKTPAEFIEKFSKVEGQYISNRAMLDYTNGTTVTASTETIEVEEDK